MGTTLTLPGPVLRPDYPLRTERLILRPWSSRDLEPFYALHHDPQVSHYLVWVPTSRADAVVKLRRLARMRGIGPHRPHLRLAVVLPGDGRVIGDVNFELTSHRDLEGEMGYVIDPAYWGNGYATEAAGEMLRLAFEDLGLHRMMAACDARNVASARVMERLGMRREGHYLQKELMRGEWCDLLTYGILESEWRARH